MKDFVKNCDCMEVWNDNTNVLRCKKSKEHDYRCEISFIGFNKENQLIGVCKYNWNIIKITKDGMENVGKIDCTLYDINKNPKILLEEAKLMSVKEIEEKLGHRVVIKQTYGN